MQLTSPVSDAADVAAALQKLGYRIIGGRALVNASREATATGAEQFATAAEAAEAAVFYFSGHGIQVGEDNYPSFLTLSGRSAQCSVEDARRFRRLRTEN